MGADTATPAAGVPVTVTWPASTDNVGVSRYEVWRSSTGSASTKAATVTGTTTTVVVPPGTTGLQFQVKAVDAAGNTSAGSVASAAAGLTLDQESVTGRIAYTGTWTAASNAVSSGGATRHAGTSSASLTYRPATGTTQVAVVMATGPAAGKASVAVDGGSAVTVDLYSATVGSRVVVRATASVSASSQHTVVVRALGTKNSASSSTRVDIDAFVTRR